MAIIRSRVSFALIGIVALLLLFSCNSIPASLTAGVGPARVTAGNDHFEIQSVLLGKGMGLYVHLPINYDPNNVYPVVYLFHGYGNNEIEWFEYYGMDKLADQLTTAGTLPPMVLVTVDMDNSWGIDSGEVQMMGGDPKTAMYAGKYESYFLREVIPVIESRYSVRKDAAGRSLGGISMGGYAALHIGLRHTNMFSHIAGHSPALKGSQIPEWFLYDESRPAAENDPVLLASTAPLDKCHIWIDCGSDDGLLAGSMAIRDALQVRKAKFEFSSPAGIHNSDYWIPRLAEYLTFYAGMVSGK